jgi:hypothetical protein
MFRRQEQSRGGRYGPSAPVAEAVALEFESQVNGDRRESNDGLRSDAAHRAPWIVRLVALFRASCLVDAWFAPIRTQALVPSSVDTLAVAISALALMALGP